MNPRKSGNRRSETKSVALVVVLFLFAVNLCFYSGRFHSIDEMALLSTTESIVKWQRTDINALAWGQWLLRGPDSQGLFNAQGDLYAKKAPLVSWLAVPVYAFAGLVQFGQVQASMLLSALIVALTGGVVFRFARRLGYSLGVSVWAALLFGLGTSALVYAKYLFTEPLAGLGFLLAAEAVWRTHDEVAPDWRVPALGGAGLGAAFLTNPVNAVFAPIFFVALVQKPIVPKKTGSSVLNMLWPFALALSVMAIWNTAHFGSPFVSGYHLGAGEGFTSPLHISLPGMLVSPARGFLWFVPASFLALAGLPWFFRRDVRLAVISLALVGGHVLAFGAWWMWWSGWGWGPRFLVPITPFIAIVALPTLDAAARRRWAIRAAVILVFAFSIGVQVLGASVGFDEYENIMTQTHLRGDPEGDLYEYGLDMLWSWRDSPIVGHVRLLRAGNADLAWLPGGHVDWLLLVPLVLWMAIAGITLIQAGRDGILPHRWWLVAGCVVMVVAVLWRAGLHPLRATYGLDPTEGNAALAAVVSGSEPGDAAMLVRHLTPTELDRFPRFPPAVGVPDEGLFGAEWNADLERLVDNAQAKHRRLWLVVRSEDDPFAVQIASRLEQRMQRTVRVQMSGYAIVLFEPR